MTEDGSFIIQGNWEAYSEIATVGKTLGGRYSPEEKAWIVPGTRANQRYFLNKEFGWKPVGRFFTEEVKPFDMPAPRPMLTEEPDFSRAIIPAIARPYQLEAAKALGYRHDEALLSLPPGSGKTLIVIMWLTSVRPDTTLIVCPAFLKEHWQRELKKWAGLDSEFVSGRKPYETSSSIVIINYDILQYWAPTFKKKFNTILFDESHMLQSKTALRTKAAMEIQRWAKRVIPMSGTPFKNRTASIFTQLHMMDPHLFRNETWFKNRYSKPKINRRGQIYYPGTDNEEEFHRITEGYIVRKTREEILPDLPMKNRIIMYTQMSDTEKDKLSAIAMRDKDEKKLQELTMTSYFTNRQMILDHLECLKEDGVEKIIIVAYHTAVIDDLVSHFKRPLVIDGRVSPKKRQSIVDKLQNDPEQEVLIAQITAAGVGFTMDAANTMVFAEMVFDPSGVEQMEDRILRITTKSTKVTYYYFVAEGTIEEAMVNVLEQKSRDANKLLDKRTEGMFTLADSQTVRK